MAIRSFQETGLGVVKVDAEDVVALSNFTNKLEEKLRDLERRLDRHYKELVSKGN